MSTSHIEQGSPEWHALRCGKATASRIADIVRKTKSGVSASRDRYMGELVAERLTGTPYQGFKSADMEWGTATEDDARREYQFMRKWKASDISAVAFIDHPGIAMAGASPDRLVGADGLLEVKCPATHTHIATMLGASIDRDYLLQMQWQMACTGRKWCDFVSYDPRMPDALRLFVKRVERDDEAIAELESEVMKFLWEVAAKVSALEALANSEAA